MAQQLFYHTGRWWQKPSARECTRCSDHSALPQAIELFAVQPEPVAEYQISVFPDEGSTSTDPSGSGGQPDWHARDNVFTQPRVVHPLDGAPRRDVRVLE